MDGRIHRGRLYIWSEDKLIVTGALLCRTSTEPNEQNYKYTHFYTIEPYNTPHVYSSHHLRYPIFTIRKQAPKQCSAVQESLNPQAMQPSIRLQQIFQRTAGATAAQPRNSRRIHTAPLFFISSILPHDLSPPAKIRSRIGAGGCSKSEDAY